MDNPRLIEGLKELYRIQKQIDELNQRKYQMKTKVEQMIIQSKMEDKKFTVGDRSISYSKKTSTPPITLKYLSSCLLDYYGNEEEANQVYEYILDKRQKTTKYQLDMIKRKSDDQ